MNDFNLGDGWREITYQESVKGRRYLREYGDDGVPTHTWVHEEPVPPLPTEPYVMIRAEWGAGSHRPTSELAFFGGDWIDVDGEGYSPKELRSRITGFEVLAEPHRSTFAMFENEIEQVRRETAKAVLVMIQTNITNGQSWSEGVAREFGVEVSS